MPVPTYGTDLTGFESYCEELDDGKQLKKAIKKQLTNKQLSVFDMFVPLMEWIICPKPGCNVYLEEFDFDQYDPIIAWTAAPHRQDEAYVLARVKEST